MSYPIQHIRIYDQTTAVRDALSRLDDIDCRVVDVRLGGREPVIHIEPIGEDQGAQLKGAMYMRERIGGRLVATYVARVCGCQVRWPAVLPPSPTPDNVRHLNGAGVAA